TTTSMTDFARRVRSFGTRFVTGSTALAVYWLFSGIVESRKCDTLSDSWTLENFGSGLALVEEIEQRYASGCYQSRLFRFNPLEFWTIVGLIRVLRDNDNHLPFPARMLIPTEGAKIEKEWLV